MPVLHACFTQAEVSATQRVFWREFKYLLCPHTAVGVHAAVSATAAWGYDPVSNGHIIVMATAHAAKFTDAVQATLPELSVGAIIDSAGSAIAATLHALPTLPIVAQFWPRPADWHADWTTKLRAMIESITVSREAP